MNINLINQDDLQAQPTDHYMNAVQQQFFRDLLINQRDALQARITESLDGLRERETSSDPADIGSAEERRQWKLGLLVRERKLLGKIVEALGLGASLAGAWRLASQSASNACCCTPPRTCASRPKNAKSNAKNIYVTPNNNGV